MLSGETEADRYGLLCEPDSDPEVYNFYDNTGLVTYSNRSISSERIRNIYQLNVRAVKLKDGTPVAAITYCHIVVGRTLFGVSLSTAIISSYSSEDEVVDRVIDVLLESEGFRR